MAAHISVQCLDSTPAAWCLPNKHTVHASVRDFSTVYPWNLRLSIYNSMFSGVFSSFSRSCDCHQLERFGGFCTTLAILYGIYWNPLTKNCKIKKISLCLPFIQVLISFLNFFAFCYPPVSLIFLLYLGLDGFCLFACLLAYLRTNFYNFNLILHILYNKRLIEVWLTSNIILVSSVA